MMLERLERCGKGTWCLEVIGSMATQSAMVIGVRIELRSGQALAHSGHGEGVEGDSAILGGAVCRCLYSLARWFEDGSAVAYRGIEVKGRGEFADGGGVKGTSVVFWGYSWGSGCSFTSAKSTEHIH